MRAQKGKYRRAMRAPRILAVGLLLLAQTAAGATLAAECAPEDFAKAVDTAGAALRKLNTDNAPRLRTKMRQLKDRNGWPDSGFEERVYGALADERIAGFDAQANDLLARIDTLGTVQVAAEPDCTHLNELAAASLELQATIKAKTAYMLSKLDQMLAEPVVAEARSKSAEAKLPPLEPSAPKAVPRPEQGRWSTTTKGEPEREVAIAAPPPPLGTLLPPEEEGYTIDEIMAASAGLFGKVSASLGSVIEHMFRKSGRPTGYVLGTEGGGAFLAGVRYGKGTLYMRSGGTHPIFWHGPSLGTDVGAAGSQTLFLIYKLQAPEQLYAAFSGIDGSAYVVGGVGATLVTNGSVVMAPIRSGIGVRLGASIGYIRFTPHATWNPF
jgi:hypothetical protein